MTTALRITDDTTQAELEEAMGNIVATLHRIPAHWADKRAGLHAKLDVLLTDWHAAATCRTCGLSRARCKPPSGCCVQCRHE